jgi:hypothetical protein
MQDECVQQKEIYLRLTSNGSNFQESGCSLSCHWMSAIHEGLGALIDGNFLPVNKHNWSLAKMDEKVTAVYLMVRQEELKPEDGGSYDAALARQKEVCLSYLQQKLGSPVEGNVEFYTRQHQLLMDIERQRIKRLVVFSLDRLAGTKEEAEAFVFELKMSGIELLSVGDENAD